MGHYPVLLFYVPFRSTALLFAKNYREHSHYCLIVAMRALYVETRLLPGSLIEALGKGKRLREDADYYDRWSEEGASFALKAAEDFLKKAQKLTKDLHKSPRWRHEVLRFRVFKKMAFISSLGDFFLVSFPFLFFFFFSLNFPLWFYFSWRL